MKKLIVYVSILILASCLMFFTGFFPQRHPSSRKSSTFDFPTSVDEVRLDVEKLYRRQYGKLVLMIVDALRLDFIANRDNMPFIAKLLQDKTTSCFMVTQTETPTVTLPRIKALVSGAVPGFLDLLYNFGSAEMANDNIILQARKRGLHVAFYGDDTWLRLFPKSFFRYEGTSSFFVNDFYEVDNNVTKNLKKELLNPDWDVLILHYLGLDHIGHVEGPFGRSIPNKLKEMDDIVQDIVRLLQQSDAEESFKGLFLLTGDHGMKNSGGHGGSSLEEVTVPVVMFNSHCSSLPMDSKLRQIDIAPFLATMLGLPIPAGSTGQVNYKLFGGLSPNASLYAAYYNTLRMKKDFASDWNEEIEAELNLGIKYYSSWMKKQMSSDNEKAARHFMNAQTQISAIRNQSNKINFFFVIGAVLLLAQALLLLFVDISAHFSNHRVIRSSTTNHTNEKLFVASFLLASTLLTLTMLLHCNLSVEPIYLHGSIATITAILTCYNAWLFKSTKLTYRVLIRMGNCYLIMVILHPIVFFSSSLIEEEHNFWYFSFATLLAYILFEDIRTMDSVLVVLVAQRFLKTLNKNGVAWSHLPDLGDWLESSENEHYLNSLYVLGLLCAMWANLKHTLHRGKLVSLDVLFLIGQGVMIYLYNRAIGRISMFPSNYPKSSGAWEVEVFWICLLGRTSTTLLTLWEAGTSPLRSMETSRFYSLLLQVHLSIVCLLVKPRNIILAPALIFFSSLMRKTVRNFSQLEVMHYWLGMVFYFYMGNTNNISSIDVTVAFVGLDEFNLILAGIFICLHTYAFPILSYLLASIELQKKTNEVRGTYTRVSEFCTNYLLLNGLPLLVFMVLIIIQREHLFIWSVFSPKLLYLLFQNILFVVLILLYCWLDH